MPSTAVSNTRRRCSSERLSVSFASRTLPRAASVSPSADSLSSSARLTAPCALELEIWLAMMRAATPAPRIEMMTADCA